MKTKKTSDDIKIGCCVKIINPPKYLANMIGIVLDPEKYAGDTTAPNPLGDNLPIAFLTNNGCVAIFWCKRDELIICEPMRFFSLECLSDKQKEELFKGHSKNQNQRPN